MTYKFIAGVLAVLILLLVPMTAVLAGTTGYADEDSSCDLAISANNSSVYIFGGLLDDILQDISNQIIFDMINQWINKISNFFNNIFGGGSSNNNIGKSGGSNTDDYFSSSRYVDPTYDPATDTGDGGYREDTIDGVDGYWYQGRWYWRWTNDVGIESSPNSSNSVNSVPYVIIDNNSSGSNSNNSGNTIPNAGTNNSSGSSSNGNAVPNSGTNNSSSGGSSNNANPNTGTNNGSSGGSSDSGGIRLLEQEAPEVPGQATNP